LTIQAIGSKDAKDNIPADWCRATPNLSDRKRRIHTQVSSLQSYLNALGVELELTIKAANGGRSLLNLGE